MQPAIGHCEARKKKKDATFFPKIPPFFFFFFLLSVLSCPGDYSTPLFLAWRSQEQEVMENVPNGLTGRNKNLPEMLTIPRPNKL